MDNDAFEGKVGYCEDNPAHVGITLSGTDCVCTECGGGIKFKTPFVRIQKTGKMWLGFPHPSKGQCVIVDE